MKVQTDKGCQRWPATARGWETGPGQTLPKSLQKKPTLPTPSPWTSSLQTTDKKFTSFQASQCVVLCHGDPRKRIQPSR